MIFTDDSKWNGVIKYEKQIAMGVEGAIHKATGCGAYGKYIDNQFENNKNCPLKYNGAYHFFDYRGVYSGRDQCKYFLDTVGDYGNLRGALDLEDNKGGGWPPLNSMYGTALREALQFVLEYVDEMGCYPILYCSSYLTTLQDTWKRYMLRNFHQCPLWVAHYGVKVPTVGGWSEWSLWQSTSDGDGYAYGNAIGSPRIDLNQVGNLNNLLKPGSTGGEQPEVLTDSQKVDVLWNAHPELH